MPHNSRLVSAWAFLAGFFLWLPAVGLSFLPLPLQPMDILVLAGSPLIALQWRSLGAGTGMIALTFIASVCLSFVVVGGEALALLHALVLALPFLLLVSIVARLPDARGFFLVGFLLASAASVGLFFAQLAIGAEALDFRTNDAFSLPPQYLRGFAFFPEVSTYATHSIIALAVCLCVLWHPNGSKRWRGVLKLLACALTAALLFSRSTSFLVITPMLCALAAGQARKLDSRSILTLLLVSGICVAILIVFFNTFYTDRLETASATRSASMRFASVAAGLSPLWRGETFGVGLGENHEILRRAFDIGRALDLRFGQLPKGVNSQIIARIFEEGWPAVLNIVAGMTFLLRGVLKRSADPVVAALMVIAAGSFLTALLVTGYRGIYTNWIWLAVPAALLAAQQPVRRSTTPNVRPRIRRSNQSVARRA